MAFWSSFFNVCTLFGVRRHQQMLKGGKGCGSRRQALHLSGLHTLAFLPGHRLKVTRNKTQPSLALIGASALRFQFAPRLDQH